jgi:3-deoxy-7-phosphoheptulonate synthase
MKKIHDLHIQDMVPLVPPKELKSELPTTKGVDETVVFARETIQKILSKKDKRLLVISGPCSIHDEKAACEYAARLKELSEKVGEAFFIVMRVYFEKPRTSVGWKGLINDPHLDGSCDIMEGLRKARRILLQITEIGVPAATEFLETITPQYVADLVSWSCVGARTTESQTHREMASGLSMPVGFKNGTNGNLSSAINAVVAAKTPQSFLGIDQTGRTCVVQTGGNPWTHIVLRGGSRPNYDPISIEQARLNLIEKKIPETIMVDCSHGNSSKDFRNQPLVAAELCEQMANGSHAIASVMIESNLVEGAQTLSADTSQLPYGQSVTDACVSWETTAEILAGFAKAVRKRREG